MQLGLNRWDWRSPSVFAAEVAEAESIGFSHAFLPVNPLAVPDPYVLLAAGVTATTAMTFGPLIETPVLRPPAVAAGSIATVDALGPGRTMLTYGIGDTAVRWLGHRPARVAELEAAVTEARHLLAGDSIDVGAVAPARLRHARPVPVWVAAGGPRTLPDDVAASFSFCGSPVDIADRLRAVRAAVPMASIVVPHPVPTPRFGTSIDFVRWFCDEVATRV
ncbi:MAG: LLM class flavin-dependent oxidoreductase [Acidimicrobiales bacterium]